MTEREKRILLTASRRVVRFVHQREGYERQRRIMELLEVTEGGEGRALGRWPAEFAHRKMIRGRSLQAVQLREQGWTWQRIGDELGVCRERARQIVAEARRRTAPRHQT